MDNEKSKKQYRVLELEHQLKELRKMFDEILYNDVARDEYRRIDEQYKLELQNEEN